MLVRFSSLNFRIIRLEKNTNDMREEKGMGCRGRDNPTTYAISAYHH